MTAPGERPGHRLGCGQVSSVRGPGGADYSQVVNPVYADSVIASSRTSVP